MSPELRETLERLPQPVKGCRCAACDRLQYIWYDRRAGMPAARLQGDPGLREALSRIQDICKPMDYTMSGPRWFVGAGGGWKETIWRICEAALAASSAEPDPDQNVWRYLDGDKFSIEDKETK